MKALTIALVLSMAVMMTGCANMRARTVAAKPCVTNPCAVPAACAPAPAKMVYKTVEK
jgi:hypothetical protein